jgi:hypothetical protein
VYGGEDEGRGGVVQGNARGDKRVNQMLKDMTLQEFKKAMGAVETDPIVDAVINDLNARSALGIKKYGTTLDANPMNLKEWIQSAYEETLDLALYLKRAMKEVNESK